MARSTDLESLIVDSFLLLLPTAFASVSFAIWVCISSSSCSDVPPVNTRVKRQASPKSESVTYLNAIPRVLMVSSLISTGQVLEGKTEALPPQGALELWCAPKFETRERRGKEEHWYPA